jgi:hypothetical protein
MTMNQILTVLVDVVTVEKAAMIATARIEALQLGLVKAGGDSASVVATMRGRLSEAEKELRSAEARLDELLVRIPPSEDVPLAWNLRFCAGKIADRAILERQLDQVEEKLSEAAAINTFSSKKNGVRPIVATSMAERDRLRDAIRELNTEMAESKALIDRYDQDTKEYAEAAAWAAAGYRGPVPAIVARVEAAYQAELDKVLEPLPPIRRFRSVA